MKPHVERRLTAGDTARDIVIGIGKKIHVAVPDFFPEQITKTNEKNKRQKNENQ